MRIGRHHGPAAKTFRHRFEVGLALRPSRISATWLRRTCYICPAGEKLATHFTHETWLGPCTSTDQRVPHLRAEAHARRARNAHQAVGAEDVVDAGRRSLDKIPDCNAYSPLDG